MTNRGPSAVSMLLVVPAAHVRQLDLHFQTAWYDVFHRRRINQISHIVCMGPIVWAMIVGACAAPLPGFGAVGPFPVNLGLVVAALLALAYFAMDRVLGLLMTPLVAALWMSANLFVGAHGKEALHSALIVLAIAGALQTWTHGLEEVPPPVSGTTGWVPFTEWRQNTPLSRQALTIALTLSFYILVEIVSSPRLLGVLGFKLLMSLGYNPKARAEIADESVRILATGGAG